MTPSEPIAIIPHDPLNMDIIYVRPDGSLCIAPIRTDDGGREELDEI